MKYKPKHIGLRHIDWVGLIVSTELPSYAKLIAYQLSSYMNKSQDIAWPSQARLIAECSISNSTLNRSLDLLESEGWLIRQSGNSKRTTRYIISFPKEIEELMSKTTAALNSPTQRVNTPTVGDRVLPHRETNIQENIQDNIGRSKFTPPEVSEVLEYCKSRINYVDAQKFHDFYTAKGWMVGKTKMKDWKACVRTWESREKKPDDKFDPYDHYI